MHGWFSLRSATNTLWEEFGGTLAGCYACGKAYRLWFCHHAGRLLGSQSGFLTSLLYDPGSSLLCPFFNVQVETAPSSDEEDEMKPW